jgi:hypothetical protein
MSANVHNIHCKERVLNIKLVHFYIFLLSRPLMPEIRREIIRRCSNMKCNGCGTLVLDHQYDDNRDIALNWASNCAIVPSEKIIKTILSEAKKKWPKLKIVQ